MKNELWAIALREAEKTEGPNTLWWAGEVYVPPVVLQYQEWQLACPQFLLLRMWSGPADGCVIHIDRLYGADWKWREYP